jgi:hypothetical protein
LKSKTGGVQMTIKEKTIILSAEDVSRLSDYRKSEIQSELESAGYTVVIESTSEK